MAWEGLSAKELCHVILDPRLGGMPPDRLVAHLGTSLVRWAWQPGHDSHGRPRSTPPMPYAQFLQIIANWVDAGAQCP
jgi:hypothetical protein